MNLGTSATILTFLSATISIIFYIFSQKKEEYLKAARWLFYLSVLLVLFQSILLYFGIFTHQFHWQYIFSYTSRELSVYYLISTFWAGQEGTFLLWLLMGSVYGVIVIRKKSKYEAIVMIFLLVVQAFIAFIMIKQNPFTMIWDKHPNQYSPGLMPNDGNGLNPLLQDPWMIIHPPILFLGYSASVLIFAFAMAGLYFKEYDAWLKEAYPFALFTSLTLGTGIILGAYWAYTTLGWGGYWGWDPVENSSLIPWLSSLAFLHAALIQKRQKALKRTTFFLGIITFMLVLWGSFLTRSGVLADFSVHSFADEGINIYLINFVLFFVFFGFFALAYRFRDIKSEKMSSNVLTRNNMMLYGMMALLIAAILTLLGTNAPLISGLFYDNPSAISTDYYNNVNMPITILIMITVAISSLLSWKKEGGSVKNTLINYGSISIVFTIFVAIFYLRNIQGIIILSFSIFTILVSSQLVLKLMKKKRLSFGGYLTHLGFSLMIIGILTTSLLDSSEKANLPQGQPVKVGKYEMTYKHFIQGEGNKSVAVVSVKLPNGKNYDAEMKYYWSEYNRSYMRNPHVYNRLIEDIYISPLQRFKNKHNMEGKGKIVSLKKNEPLQFENYTMIFTGYDMDAGQMGGEMVVKAVIQILDRNSNTQTIIKPGIEASGKNRKDIPATLENTHFTFHIKNINVTEKSLSLEIIDEEKPASMNSDAPKETLAVEVSIKPFIGVLWFGTILIILGMFISQINAIRKNNAGIQ